MHLFRVLHMHETVSRTTHFYEQVWRLVSSLTDDIAAIVAAGLQPLACEMLMHSIVSLIRVFLEDKRGLGACSAPLQWE